ncbi:hypothetical protein N7535_007639 [Penicillium sp. DV-2018c]|nr:hypothetical protein N7535_007639 [Penicillium sp. DV-2018c]
MDVQGNAEPERAPKRRRSRGIPTTCTPCRARKMRCDRDYPTCGRCLKNGTPTECTYEDVLSPQPNTLATTTFAFDGSSTVPLAGIDHTSVGTPSSSGSGLGKGPAARTEPSQMSEAREGMAGGPMHRGYQGPMGNALAPPYRDQPHDRERRGSFLETVLGASKEAVSQETYLDTGLLQRPKRQAPAPEQRTHVQSQVDDERDDNEAEPLSLAHQLGISPRILIRVHETQTRFNGSGVFANLLAQFPDIVPFAKGIKQSSPVLRNLQPDLRRAKRGLFKPMVLGQTLPDPTTASLIELVPSRGVVDELVSLYLTYVESTHRVLHVPTFSRQLDQFWAKRDDTASISAAFAAQVLLVLACAWNFADSASLQTKSIGKLKCQSAIEWTLHAGKCIENFHTKRPDITSLRLSILLILARNSLGMQRSQAWLSTSNLVKQAMMAGYHRDPSRSERLSPFHKEMRRRIWTTIVELDLQVALDRGMPPSVQSYDYDTSSGFNIDDNEIREDSTDVPKNRPLGEVTDSSFQCVLSRSLPIRLQACSLMHSPRITCRYEDIQRLDAELNRQLSRIPTWVTPDSSNVTSGQKAVWWKSLIEIKISQSLLSIHTPFAIEARAEALFAPSARSLMDSAIRILSIQRLVHQVSQQLSLRMLGEWTMHAYLAICHLLHPARSGIARAPAPCRPVSSAFLLHNLPGIPDSLLSLIEAALVTLEERSLMLTKGASDYYFLSTLVALVKAQLWPDQAMMYRQQVVERILSFTQVLFSRHANCDHLDERGLGDFKVDQLAKNKVVPAMIIQPIEFDRNQMPPPHQPGGATQIHELDSFLETFDWEDLTAATFPY